MTPNGARLPPMSDDPRLTPLNNKPVRKDAAYVLYWMQASQRTRYNHALNEAIGRANRLSLPLVVGFGVTDSYPDANARSYAFMLQGLADVAESVAAMGGRFILRRGSPETVAIELARDAACVVCDRGYLRHQKAWRDTLASGVDCAAVQVESDVVVPVDLASDKLESAARTIRRKINDRRDAFIEAMETPRLETSAEAIKLDGLDATDWQGVLSQMDIDRSVAPVEGFTGGERAGRGVLQAFLDNNLNRYDAARSVPHDGAASRLSPYLHFGQLSPVECAYEARQAGSGDGLAAFLEEMIVRRELAINFVHFCPGYDRYEDAVPDWAQATLRAHDGDERPDRYDRDALEAADTHDEIWNAAMTEMLREGYLNNHVRMYWAKRILDWSATPKEAFETALHLNNKYFLDGRDPNSYANIAWTFGRHDRPFQERAVIGKVRPFGDGALKRRFNVKDYVARVLGGDLFG